MHRDPANAQKSPRILFRHNPLLRWGGSKFSRGAGWILGEESAKLRACLGSTFPNEYHLLGHSLT